MIWESFWLIDLVRVLVGSAILVLIIALPRKSNSAIPTHANNGIYLILIGLSCIGLYYFADLFSMFVMPSLVSGQQSMEFVIVLHQNWSWVVVLISVSTIGSGTWLLASKLVPDSQQNMSHLEERVYHRTKDLQHINIQLEETANLLIAEQSRFRDFAEIAADWFWEIDEKFTYVYRSERSRLITGLSDTSPPEWYIMGTCNTFIVLFIVRGGYYDVLPKNNCSIFRTHSLNSNTFATNDRL